MREVIRRMIENHGKDATMEALREYRRRLKNKVDRLISEEGTIERLEEYRRVLKPEVVEELNAIMRRPI